MDAIQAVYFTPQPADSDLDQGDEVKTADDVVAKLGSVEAAANAEAERAGAELAALRAERDRAPARRASEAWRTGEAADLSDLDLSEEHSDVVDLAEADPNVRREIDQARAVAEIWERSLSR